MNQISTRLTTFINRFTRTELIAAGILGASSILALSFGKRYFNGGVCNISKDLSGQIVVITGANTGIGKETARILASMGATVILACRDPLKADAAVEELRRVTNNPRIEFMHLDLGDLESIKAFAEEFRSKYQKLNILINNAGVMAPNTRTLTKDGLELQFQVNYLGHFYLTKSLLDIIKASGPSRIINLSSVRHEKGRMHWDDLMFEHKYSPFVAYDQSKLAVVMFTKELQKRLDQEGADVKVVALHPGLVRTELGRHVKQNFTTKLALILATPLYIYVTKDIHQGAQTTLYCALTDHHNLKGGYYYSDCKVTGANPEAVIGENGERLWEYSEKVISQKLKEPIWL